MKKYVLPLFSLMLLAPAAHAQDLLQQLLSAQSQPQPDAGSTNAGGGPGTMVRPPEITNVTSTSGGAANCPTSGQKTIPLVYLNAMLKVSGDKIRVSPNSATGTINIQGNDIVSNCDSMLRWNLRSPSTSNPNYIVEVQIAESNCSDITTDRGVEKRCEYDVMKKDDQQNENVHHISVTPNFDGYKQCLRETGVLGANGVDNSKAIRRPLDVNLTGAGPSGEVLFGSNLPMACEQYRRRFVSGCYYAEDITQTPTRYVSRQDQEQHDLDARRAQICRTGSIQEMSEFIQAHGPGDSLVAIRDNLILTKARELATKLRGTDDISSTDLSVIRDFQRYVVDPLVTEMMEQYRILNAPNSNSEAKRAAEGRIAEIKQRLDGFRRDPGFNADALNRLMAAGKFTEARDLKTFQLTLSSYSRLGNTENNRLITPQRASALLEDGMRAFEDRLADRREEYDVRHGTITGLSDQYTSDARFYRERINRRNADYTRCITEELQKAQPGGQCYRGWLTQQTMQRCLREVQENVLAWRQELNELNQQDQDDATDAEAKAEQYRGWEEEGRRVATTSDDDSEARAPTSTDARTPSRSSRRTSPEMPRGGTSFNFQPQGQNGQLQSQNGELQGQNGQLQLGQNGQLQLGQSGQLQLGQLQGINGLQMNGMNGMSVSPLNGLMLGGNMGLGTSYNNNVMVCMQMPQLCQQQTFGAQGFFNQQQNPFLMNQMGMTTLPFIQQPTTFGSTMGYSVCGNPLLCR